MSRPKWIKPGMHYYQWCRVGGGRKIYILYKANEQEPDEEVDRFPFTYEEEMILKEKVRVFNKPFNNKKKTNGK